MNVSLSISPRINASTDSSSSSLTRASCAAVKRDRTLDTRVSSPTADASSSSASTSAGNALDASVARRLPAGRDASSRSIARLRPSASRSSRVRSPTTCTSSGGGGAGGARSGVGQMRSLIPEAVRRWRPSG
eukprot:1225191-Prymnesium_polylepis.1